MRQRLFDGAEDTVRNESHRPEQTGRFEIPTGCVKRFVHVAHEVDVVELLPRDASSIKIANSVGREIGHLDLDLVAVFFEFP